MRYGRLMRCLGGVCRQKYQNEGGPDFARCFALVSGAARRLQFDPRNEFSGDAVIERIVELVEQRCALTIRRLIEPAAGCAEVGE